MDQLGIDPVTGLQPGRDNASKHDAVVQHPNASIQRTGKTSDTLTVANRNATVFASRVELKAYAIQIPKCPDRYSVLRSRIDGAVIPIAKGSGEYSIVLDPIQLYSGRYYARSWIMNTDDSAGIAGGESDWFEVRSSTVGAEGTAAVFEPNRRWRAATEMDSTAALPIIPSRSTRRNL